MDLAVGLTLKGQLRGQDLHMIRVLAMRRAVGDVDPCILIDVGNCNLKPDLEKPEHFWKSFRVPLDRVGDEV